MFIEQMISPLCMEITLKYPSVEDVIRYLWFSSMILIDFTDSLCTWLVHTLFCPSFLVSSMCSPTLAHRNWLLEC